MNDRRGFGSFHIITASLAAIIVVFAACSGNNSYKEMKAVRQTFNVVVQATGQLSSSASLYIGCPAVERMWEFTIEYMAPEGKNVMAGERILSFDSRELTEKLQVRMSELNTEKKELERMILAEQEVQADMVLKWEDEKVKKGKARRKTDIPPELTAANEQQKMLMDLELSEFREKLAHNRLNNQTSATKTRIQLQKSKIKRIEDEVGRLQADIEKMVVKAVKNGMIVYTPNWQGKKKNVGDSCWFGETILELPDLEKMQMNAVILEPQAGKIQVGQEAEIRLDSNMDHAYKGKITSLGRIFRVKSNSQPVVVFDALIDLPESDPLIMRPGMAATARILVSSRQDVLQVPEAALLYQEKGIHVRKKGLLSDRLVPVTTGSRSGGMVEITSGLRENETILLRGADNGKVGR